MSLMHDTNTTFHLVPEDYSPVKLALRATFASFTAIFSIATNAICLVVLPRVTSLPENNRLFLLSLTASDLGTGIGAFIYIVPAANGQWIYSDILCDFVSFFMSVFGAVSILTLICLSMDKYIAIMKPLRYHQFITRRRVMAVIAITWIICSINIMCVYTPVFGGTHVSYSISRAGCGPELTNSDSSSIILTITIGVSTVLLPLISISFIYLHLYRITRQQILEFQKQQALTNNDNQKKSLLRGEGKAIRMFASITVTYAIVWTPYFVALTYTNLTHKTLPWLDFIAFWLVISGSWCDATILAGMSLAFRNAAKQLFTNYLVRLNIIRRYNRTEPAVDVRSCNTIADTLTQVEMIDK